MSIKIGSIELFAGPSELGAPDDLETALISFIDQAQKKLDIAVQELQSLPVAEAIIRARQRKVTVRIVPEQDYLRVSRMLSAPFEPFGEDEENRFLHNALLRSNIDVKVDYNTGIFHQKFMIRDSNAALTGSANFTHTDLHKNLNHLVIIQNAETAKINTRGIESANKVMLMAAIAYNLKKLLTYRGNIGNHTALMGFKDLLNNISSSLLYKFYLRIRLLLRIELNLQTILI